jgi:1-acyl-sn-glycerol-3-phosphate acyltransferase
VEDWRYRPAGDLGLPLRERLRSLRREGGLAEPALRAAWWMAVRAYLKTCHRLEVRGREHLPVRLPFVLIANHASHLDALVLGSELAWDLRERVHPLAAGDAFFESLPVSAFAAFAMNALPLWRRNFDPDDIEALRRRLTEQPCGFVLFPEGTRTRTGRMGPFKRGLGMLVAGTSVPVIPCRIDGAFQALPPTRVWPRFSRLRLTIGEPLLADRHANSRDGWIALAAEAQERVVALS